jgi:hypothetical protein
MLNLPAQARVSQYLDDKTAVIEQTVDGEQVASLASSMLPLRARGKSGANEPVDFTLEAAQDGFQPRNPLVTTRMPSRLSYGFEVGPLRVKPEVRGGEGSAARWEDSIFYGNIDADTEALLKPIPNGVELFHQLRSADAPEQLRVELDLPEGIRAEQEDGAIRLERDGRAVGRIAPIWAVDASGASVPASMNECHYLGFYSGAYNAWTSGHPGTWCYAHGVTGVWTQCAASGCTGGGSDGNRAIWGTVTNGGSYRTHNTYDSNLANATIYIQDTTVPTISPNRSGGQTFEEPAGSVAFDTRDNGVGLKKVVFSRLATSTLPETELWREQYTCAGIWRNRCPDYDPTDINLDGSNISYGTSTIRVQAWDYLDNYARYDWTVTKNRDTPGPTITPSNTLWDGRSGTFNDRVPLKVDAGDSGVGVRKISVYVNGTLQADGLKEAGSCAAGRCPLDHVWYLDFTDLNLEGSANTIEVRSTDFAGNWNTVSWPINVTDPEPGGLSAVPTDPQATDSSFAAPVGEQYCEPAGTAGGECTTVPPAEVDDSRTLMSLSRNPALGAGGTGWGIAEDDFEGLETPQFQTLNPRVARKIVPWDIMNRNGKPVTYQCQKNSDGTAREEFTLPADTWTLGELNHWLNATQSREIVISFERTRDARAYCVLPSRTQYREAISAFMQWIADRGDAPRVKYYVAWNEPNHAGQPTFVSKNRNAFKDAKGNYKASGPIQAGRFYRELFAECKVRGCVPAAGEFVDDHSLKTGTFWRRYLSGVGNPPTDADKPAFARYWAIHAYNMADTGDYSWMRKLIPQLRERNSGAELWFGAGGAAAQVPSQPDARGSQFPCAHGRAADPECSVFPGRVQQPALEGPDLPDGSLQGVQQERLVGLGARL